MNQLATETSPYLRQHADNPVHWRPWSTEAFDEARRRDVPVLLSVGYSSCHWCHVMAHESFEDEAAAELVNDAFVPIKVDREERPDVDAIYMEAVQALTGHGGWPMTVFLDHGGRPFFGGTYFPAEARGGLPSFTQLCTAISEMWNDPDKRGELDEQAARLTESLGHLASLDPDPSSSIDASILDAASQRIADQFDSEWGGVGQAPKFPMAMSLDLLLRHHAATGEQRSLDMVTTTLLAMASGGIRDHVGGGYSRYSVDAFWMVPHFEKMLYDQALIGRVLLHAGQITGDQRFRLELDELIAYVLRDLRHPDGGLYSAEDADSEGEEGRFYVWRPEEMAAAIGDDALTRAAIDWWGVTSAGNFEGANILHRPVRGDLIRPPDVEEARRRLFAARQQRVRPGLDDKVLTEWNGLMVSLLAEAAATTGDATWLEAAAVTGHFLLDNLRDADGRWLRSWQADGGARHRAYATDLAAVCDAFVRLHEATGRARWVAAAVEAADQLLDHHLDVDRGGFFTTAHDAEPLVTRPKDLLDNAVPSGSSSAAFALARLGALTGADRFREAAEGAVSLIAGPARQHPTAFGHALAAVDILRRTSEVCIAGDRPDLRDVVRERWLPTAVVTWGERFDSPLWDHREEGRAYFCEGYACKAPATTPDELRAALGTG